MLSLIFSFLSIIKTRRDYFIFYFLFFGDKVI